MCTGCTLCEQICPVKAISGGTKNDTAVTPAVAGGAKNDTAEAAGKATDSAADLQKGGRHE